MATVRLLDTTFVERVWGTHALLSIFSRLSGSPYRRGLADADAPLPLLFKFLFTTDKLSVQVHPGGVDGKTEMWHVLRAEPDSKVAVGF
jgi:mannose-6-phosphate isomerase